MPVVCVCFKCRFLDMREQMLPSDEKETGKGDCIVVGSRLLCSLGLAKNRAPLCAKIMRPEGMASTVNKRNEGSKS